MMVIMKGLRLVVSLVLDYWMGCFGWGAVFLISYYKHNVVVMLKLLTGVAYSE